MQPSVLTKINFELLCFVWAQDVCWRVYMCNISRYAWNDVCMDVYHVSTCWLCSARSQNRLSDKDRVIRAAAFEGNKPTKWQIPCAMRKQHIKSLGRTVLQDAANMIFFGDEHGLHLGNRTERKEAGLLGPIKQT